MTDLPDIPYPVQGSIALALCIALWLIAVRVVRKGKDRDELNAARARKLEELAEAEQAWRDAVLCGTVATVQEARRKVAAIRGELRRIQKAMAALIAIAFCAGCVSGEKERVVVVSEQARIVEPGYVVPDYPDGETRWWLATPTGLEVMVPDFQKEGW